MPVRTPHFGLEAFVVGDVYSAIVDARRFTIIDSHMAFISDLVGPGKITGWDLSVPTPLTLNVSSGWGMIGRFITRTFGDYKKSLLDNSTVYVWMRLRAGIIGQISPFSGIVVADYVDSIPPSQVVGVSVISKSIDSVLLGWTNSSEVDFAKYEIYKSSDNITYSLLAESETNEYLDTDLSENTIYYYKVKAVDQSGNSGTLSSYLLVITDKDLSVPANPSRVLIENSDKIIHLTWNSAPYGNVVMYRAYVTPVSEERISTGSTFTIETDSDGVDLSIDALENGQRYLIVLKSVTKWGIESDGVTRLGQPIDTDGPQDVVQMVITDYESTSGASTNGLTLTWSSFSDPYNEFTGASEILIEEYRSDGTVISSDWIPTISGSVTRNIEVFPYKKNGQTFYKSVEPRTLYYVTIRNIGSNGVRSLGKRVKHTAKSFKVPDSIQSMSVVQRNDGSILLSWANSPSIFSSNILTVRKMDLETSIETVIVDEEDIGKATTYILPTSSIFPNFRYTFEIYCVDEFDNHSVVNSTFYEIGQSIDLPRPAPPTQQFGFAGDKQNVLTWNAAQSDEVVGYRIYRANDTSSIDPSAFVLLETVPSTVFAYTDYEVQNGTSYIYFVTTLDFYGKESLNPINDRYADFGVVTLKPSSSSTLNAPSSLTSTIAGNSVQLVWQPTAGQFDGYEIYRSIGNKYSYRLLATVLPAVTYYVDTDVLKKSGKVYYMVRKFRNEADLFVTESNLSVSNAIFLGKVSTVGGVSTIDVSDVRDIAMLEDPVRQETRNRIAVHKHQYVDANNDNRINLGDSMIVSNWISDNNQTYTTETDISQTTTFTVYLNGEDASSYGILYTIDKDKGSLTFEAVLAATGFELDTTLTFPFESPPTVEVEFGNLEETQGVLPKNRINGVSAQQVGVGVFEKVQVHNVSHDGRIKERLEPVQITTITIDDGYKYAPSNADDTIGDAVVFYCIIQATGDSNILVAGTSDGIYTSENFGISWERRFETITPVLKFFYSDKYETYFAATNRGILFGRGGQAGDFSIWTEVAGTENTKIIRDIIEDDLGDVFCSSDLGIYKLRRDIGQGSFFFQQTPIFGPRSTEAYAMLHDAPRNRIIASNELGIFETDNGGVSWSFSSEFTEQRVIHSFVAKNGYIFAITDYMLWRRSPTGEAFERIGVMENAFIARKLVIWNDRIYVSTDSGLLATISDSDIFTDLTVSFETAFSQLRIGDDFLPSSSLDVIDNKLFIGSEDRLFISDRPGRISLHWQNKSEIIPTVYVNGEKQTIGYRFSTSQDRLRKFVCFDVKQKLGAVVTIANQYKKFKAKNGGWADTNYIAAVSLFIDGRKMNEISLSERPAQTMASLILPVYNDRNAHQVGADLAKAKFDENRTALLTVQRDDNGNITQLTGFTKGNVIATLYSIERFLSQIYDSAKVVSGTDAQGNTIEVPFSIPQFRVLLLNQTSGVDKNKYGTFGDYKTWVKDTDNSTSSVIGNFGSELDTDGILPQKLIGGSGDLGSIGGGG